MKQLFIVFFVAMFAGMNAQTDSAKKEIAVIIGGSFGGGFSAMKYTSEYNYAELLNEKPFYVTYSMYCSVLFREKIGLRITGGRVGGSTAASTSIDELALSRFPDYHYLPEYSELHAGYHYTYITPQFTYRLGSEPFNATLCLGAGMGKLHTPHGTAVLQKNGSNDFIELEYYGEDIINYHTQADIEIAYMRQLSQHVFANVGLYITSLALFSSYEFHYSETKYAQPTVYLGGGHRSDFLMHYNAGLFLNFQWNKRESPRAYYE